MSRFKPSVCYNLAIIGPGGVGKSAIVIQFIMRRFVVEYDPTIEDSYRTQREVDGITYHMDIFDTAGQEEFSALRHQYVKSGDGFMIVYSITDRDSFSQVEYFRQTVLESKGREDKPQLIPIMIIGNKCDLENRRAVEKREGIEIAKQMDCPFLETSASTTYNIENSFLTIIRHIRNIRRLYPESAECGSGKDFSKDTSKRCTIL